MPGPFPGMDPYLEAPAHWHGVHHTLIVYIADTLNATMPPAYVARVEERCSVVQTQRNLYPDVLVRQQAPLGSLPSSTTTATVSPTASLPYDLPYIVEMLPLEPSETYLDIVDSENGNEIITTVEILSPENKAYGKGRTRYQTKQRDILNSRTHLIEIDLLRAGLPIVAAGHPDIADLPAYDYLICLHRSGQGTRYETWPVTLGDRLPRITVPLTEGETDIPLDLQSVLDHCYDRGRYRHQIDYTRPPIPPLTTPNATWAEELLRSKGLRP